MQFEKIIEQIIKSSRANQSHGLPIGSAASRLLAEGLLNDTDRMLAAKGIRFTRYVDDFRIFAESEQSSHSILCQLAEHLMVTEGLSLNASKTRLTDTKRLGTSIEDRLTDVFSRNELEQINQFIRATYDGEDVISDGIDSIDSVALSERLAELLKRGNVDYSAIKVILKALRAAADIPAEIIMRDFSILLYFVPRDFCLLVGAVSQRSPPSGEVLANELLRLVKEAPFCDMALSRVWLGHLLVTGGLPLSQETLSHLPEPKSVLENRQRWLMRGLLGDRAALRAQKTRLAEFSEWEKPALLLAASCLAESEYETWLNLAKDHLNDPLRLEFASWLKSLDVPLSETLREDYWRADPTFEPPKAYI